MNFTEFNLDSRLKAGIDALGYTAPTPIQTAAIPVALSGQDLIGTAQTGTGKTAAFVLPLLNRLLNGPRGVARALIITPTRELAGQIDENIKALALGTRLRSATIYGGVGAAPQIAALRNGVEILVACPGRLLDLVESGYARLGSIEILVLDEADRMFDMGFLPSVKRILKLVPGRRQTMLFSATFPAEVEELASQSLVKPQRIVLGLSRPVHTVTHALFPVPQHVKAPLLLELLKRTDTGSVLIFTRTKHRAKRLGEQLEKAGYKAASLQGNLSQNRRQAALDGFRDGSYQVLVATDIAARGIDVSQISHVVNYDIPDTAEAYIHRIGRTGRAARSGDAFTLVTSEDTAMVRIIEKKLNAQIERRTVEGFDYSVPAPHKDSEFARPPMPPRNHGKKTAAKPGAHNAGGAHAGTPRSDSAGKPRPQGTKPAHPSAAPAARHPQRAPRAR